MWACNIITHYWTLSYQYVNEYTRNNPSLSVQSFELLGLFRREITSYADGVWIWQMTAILQSHDKNMATSCVCCDESKSKFYSERSDKCALYEIKIYELKFRFKSSKKQKYFYVELLPENFYWSVYEVIFSAKMAE